MTIEKKPLRERYQLWKSMTRLTIGWQLRTLRARKTHVVNGNPRRLVIIPSDPWTLTGAKGDEAMMQAVVGQLSNLGQPLEVGVVTATAPASAAAQKLGFIPIEIWDAGFSATVDAIEKFDPDALVLLGADCMDGYYSPHTTLRLLATADISARQGVRASLLGFSFNESPSPYLKFPFNNLTPTLAINVRDNISLKRFNHFCEAPAQLVSDSAFMLKACVDSASVKDMASWVESRRATGDTVVAFNIHPMLLKDRTNEALARINASAISALRRLMTERPVSVVLLSHDYRGTDGDDTCLRVIHQALQADFSGSLRYTTEPLSAAELKAMAGLLDGVITGRMHLAIASLGMGVPVAALTYQDKFQGLMDHFELPHSLLLSPAKVANPEELYALLIAFTAQLQELRQKVSSFLPGVLAASQLNIKSLVSASRK